MAITMTAAAALQVKKVLEDRSNSIGLRLGVKPSGCSGMGYVLEFADEVNVEDQVFMQDGVQIIIDQKSLVYLTGTQLDYVKEGLNEGFKFQNPNAVSECGCGESFTV